MQQDDYRKAADYIYGELRMKTLPVGVKFLTDPARMPEKTRRPSVTFGKKVTICQGVTMARNYGWTVGLTREDLICVPAMIVFGFSDSQIRLPPWWNSSAESIFPEPTNSPASKWNP